MSTSPRDLYPCCREDPDKIVRANIKLLMQSGLLFDTVQDLAPAFSEWYKESVTADWIGNVYRDKEVALTLRYVRAVKDLYGVTYEQLESPLEPMLFRKREEVYADALKGLALDCKTNYLITSRRMTYAAVPPELAHAWHAIRFANNPLQLAVHDTLARTVHDSFMRFEESRRPRITNRLCLQDWQDMFYFPAQPGVTREDLLLLLVNVRKYLRDCELKVILHNSKPTGGQDTEFIVTSDSGAGRPEKLLIESKRGDHSGVIWTTSRRKIEKAYDKLRNRAAEEGGTEVGTDQIERAERWIEKPHTNPAAERFAAARRRF